MQQFVTFFEIPNQTYVGYILTLKLLLQIIKLRCFQNTNNII